MCLSPKFRSLVPSPKMQAELVARNGFAQIRGGGADITIASCPAIQPTCQKSPLLVNASLSSFSKSLATLVAARIMGYCGKPSAACERCRYRRLKVRPDYMYTLRFRYE